MLCCITLRLLPARRALPEHSAADVFLRINWKTQEFFGQRRRTVPAILSAMQRAGVTQGPTEFAPLPQQRALPSARILLVVEDNLIGQDLADSLELLGYAVDDIVTSELAPLAENFRLRSDVVVVDLELHGQIEPIEAGQLIGARWHCPVVYLVDDVQQADRVTQLGDGAPHVMWPFVPGALDEAIRSVLEKCSNDPK